MLELLLGLHLGLSLGSRLGVGDEDLGEVVGLGLLLGVGSGISRNYDYN